MTAQANIDSIKRVPAPVVEINAQAWFDDPAFVRAISKPGIMTWHTPGDEPGEFSDVVVFVSPSNNGEGSEQGSIPDDKWDAIIAACKEVVTPEESTSHIIVRIMNMD